MNRTLLPTSEKFTKYHGRAAQPAILYGGRCLDFRLEVAISSRPYEPLFHVESVTQCSSTGIHIPQGCYSVLPSFTGKAIDVVGTCRKPVASQSYSTVPVWYDKDETSPWNKRVGETRVRKVVSGDRDVDMYLYAVGNAKRVHIIS